MQVNHASARAALHFIPADLPREDWVRAAMAAHAAGLSFEDFDEWSSLGDSYKHADAKALWRSIKPDRGIGAGTLFKMAKDHGWRPEGRPPRLPAGRTRALRLPVFNRVVKALHANPDEAWSRFAAATGAHPYVQSKAAEAVPLNGLRVVPAGDPLRIANESMVGALVVPVLRKDGTVSSLQFITHGETANRLKANGRSSKLNLPGASLVGWFTVGDLVPGGLVYLCEGIGQAWACWKATGSAAVVCFGWARVANVAKGLRVLDPMARLVVVPDVGKEAAAEEVARDVNAMVARMPEGWPTNSDVHDLMRVEGVEKLSALLATVKAPAEPPLPLDAILADDLPDVFEAPDEIVQGLITSGACSMVYGDSNSGKTFMVIDMACAVARGISWMNRRTEQGIVVYIAAESPASVRSRVQAYKLHHKCSVPNLVIVQKPLDLFSGDMDTDGLICLVRELERRCQKKVRLIIGDTLARLSAGANENSGEDMGLVVKRIDRARTECETHFLVIHHTGKSAASGARGWSGIRAAMDTEIEVTAGVGTRCVEVTKQRDLPSRGHRIGFDLETMLIGETKWGEPASTCIVKSQHAPQKVEKAKRLGSLEILILRLLESQPAGLKKSEIVENFKDTHAKGPVYRALLNLVKTASVRQLNEKFLVDQV